MQLLEKARNLLDQGHPEQAMPVFVEVLHRNATSFEANESLGLIYADKGDYGQALPYFEAGAKSSPKEATAHTNLGASLLVLHLDRRAVTELEQASTLDPGNAEVAANLGRGWMKLKQPRNAAKAFAKAVTLQPSSADLLYNWALALYDSEEFARVPEVLSRIKPSDVSDQSEALCGDAEEKLGHFQSAATHLRYAAELVPSEPNLYAFAVELLRHWSWQQAIELTAFARSRYPASDRLSAAQGIAQYGNASYPQAADIFADLLAASPGNLMYAEVLGRACSLMAEDARSRCSQLQAFADAHPENAAIALHAATALLIRPQGEQDLPRAEKLLQRAIQSKPEESEACYQLGILYQQELRWPESIAALKKAVDLRPTFAEAHYRLARAYFHLGDRIKGDQEIALQKQFQDQEKEARDQQMRSVTLFLFDQH